MDGCEFCDDGCRECCEDCFDATGGQCARHYEPECTCYELTGGHMPGCYFNRKARADREQAATDEAARGAEIERKR